MRYTPGSNRVKTHILDKEQPFANTKKEDKTATQPVLYHSVGPDTSVAKGTNSHVYTDDPLEHVYQYADTGLHCHNESTTGTAQVGNIYNVIIPLLSCFSFLIPGSGGI